jgi:hypothetical protein
MCARRNPIPFVSKVKKMDKVDGTDVDRGPTYGVTIVTRTTNCQIKTAENNKSCFEAKAEPRKKSLAFLFDEINA